MAKSKTFDEKLRESVFPLIRKGMQHRKPREFKVSLRAELVDFLEAFCALPEVDCGETILVRGMIEDFYDRYKHLVELEWSGNE